MGKFRRGEQEVLGNLKFVCIYKGTSFAVTMNLIYFLV